MSDEPPVGLPLTATAASSSPTVVTAAVAVELPVGLPLTATAASSSSSVAQVVVAVEPPVGLPLTTSAASLSASVVQVEGADKPPVGLRHPLLPLRGAAFEVEGRLVRNGLRHLASSALLNEALLLLTSPHY